MDVVKEIVKQLHSAFPACEIYTESIEQGFCTPCFSIRQLSASIKPYPGKRYYNMQAFDVRYFSAKRRVLEDCRKIAAQLEETLEYLPDYTARGTNMEWEITDKVLHFFVQYNYFTRQQTEKDTMGALEVVQYAANENQR